MDGINAQKLINETLKKQPIMIIIMIMMVIIIIIIIIAALVFSVAYCDSPVVFCKWKIAFQVLVNSAIVNWP